MPPAATIDPPDHIPGHRSDHDEPTITWPAEDGGADAR
jgi:hypothetical protein